MDNLFVIFVNYLGGRFKGGSCGHNRCSICFSCWSIIKTCYGGLITYAACGVTSILEKTICKGTSSPLAPKR
ncbi:hypothetical protein HanOQP8_Chr08g0274971 [Helianthus annuus]|nr:hypothetical protein HanHA89_Chr08g0285391 [Helianthus annuus]KAJ0721384.1 hypothetical protein HanOQP8_Chr08g0274971 [Helianthus annuus]